MLQHLTIQNYALIRHLEIKFKDGFTVITGETGTGKSILLGALGLILGKRADTKVLLDKSEKCIVEGSFFIKNYKLESLFLAHDLDYDNQTLIRREINTQGKSRAFINDTPVNLNVLQEIGERLVDIHSQHQNLALKDSDFQVSILDSYAGILDEVHQYRKNYRKFLDLSQEHQKLVEMEHQSNTEKDYYEYLFAELDRSNLKEREQEELEEELKILDHAEEIRSVLFHASESLENERGGVLSDLSDTQTGLNKIKTFTPELDDISKRFDSIRIELHDLLQELEKFAEQVNINPDRAHELNERLNTIYGLQQKHRVSSIAELADVLADLKQKLQGIENLESQIGDITGRIDALKKLLIKSANLISVKRKKVIPHFVEELKLSIHQLGMPNGSFKVDHTTFEIPGKDGRDQIQFLFNANKGGELREVSKVASGGEKSRLMLAIKSMISKKELLPTIVFDEIDTGVSGAVADRVGGILYSLSSTMQVIAITHLPQIAGKGVHHYQVYKNVSDNLTSTHVKKLNAEERIFEIAKLLSGQEVTEASVESAKHLLNN